MKLSKKTITALITGGVIFTAAAIAGIASSNGYALYKNALKKMLVTDNYTMLVKAAVSVDGNEYANASYSEEVNLGSETEAYVTTYENGSLSSESFYQDNIHIFGDSKQNYTIYDESECEPRILLSDLLGTNYKSDKKTEKFVRFAELAADLLIGDLKNNFIYEGSENGVSSYSISLDTFQIPEIIRSGIDLIITAEHEHANIEAMKENIDNFPLDYLYKDIVIENVTCKVKVNEDGYLSENNIQVTVSGLDWDDLKHEALFRINVLCSDFGTTVPKHFDYNTKSAERMSDVHKTRIAELEKILATPDLSEDERNKYSSELEFRKSFLEK